MRFLFSLRCEHNVTRRVGTMWRLVCQLFCSDFLLLVHGWGFAYFNAHTAVLIQTGHLPSFTAFCASVVNTNSCRVDIGSDSSSSSAILVLVGCFLELQWLSQLKFWDWFVLCLLLSHVHHFTLLVVGPIQY